MPQLCTNNPLPTFNGLYSQFSANLTNYKFTMPSLPTLPSPMFPSTSFPNVEMVTSISMLQVHQYMQTCMGMLTGLCGYLGSAIDSLIPACPVLNVKLPELLTGDPSALLASIKAQLSAGISFPGIPSPLFPDVQFPEFSSIMTLVNVIKTYIMSIPAAIFSIIGSVTSALKITGMTAMPTMPSLSTLQGLVMANVPNGQTYYDALKSGIPTSQMFNFTVPGFPALPAMPSPLFPSINFPEGEFYLGFGNMIDTMTLANLTQTYNFCENSLASKISFTFPTQCITFQ